MSTSLRPPCATGGQRRPPDGTADRPGMRGPLSAVALQAPLRPAP
jgi:hypothetical protein